MRHYTRSNARLRALREHFEASMVSAARFARRRHHAGLEMRNAAHLVWEDLGAGDSIPGARALSLLRDRRA